ncbi:MAG: hypothetical protein JST30_05290 [Armatimonadetes bacterium]|nr:hypothetical protein [Armatimonadota bacterium]
MKGRAASLVFSCFLASAACAAPDLLIVQVRPSKAALDSSPLLVAPYLAEELDRDGRVRPVVWSNTDPVFRQWTASRPEQDFVPYPDLRTALDGARSLGVERVLVVQVWSDGGSFIPSAELFVAGRSRWRLGPKDPSKKSELQVSEDGKVDAKAIREFSSKIPGLIDYSVFTVMTDKGPDWDMSARAISHSWRVILCDGPLKDLPARPRLDGEGTTGLKAEGPDPLLEAARREDVLEVADWLLADGKAAQAVRLLRAACDARPFDGPLRLHLARTLVQAGLPEEGAVVAAEAAKLNPGDPGAQLACAEAWVASGESGRALAALDLCRQALGTTSRFRHVEADVDLLSGDPQKAAAVYAQVAEPRSALRLAVAYALMGEPERCAEALKSAPAGPVPIDQYESIVLFLERALPTLTETLKATVPTARTKEGDPAVLASAQRTARLTESMRVLVAGLTAPKRYADSHESRRLAHILLAQAALEALKFVETNDPEIAEEALASLGQAMKLQPRVRQMFGLERKYGA